jgi:hypothetical protein
MSSIEFRIDDWIQAEDPDPRRAATSAEFVILVDDIPITRLFDTWSRTVTDRARLPLYPLAEWLAGNWWRLHAEAPYEGGGPPPAQWRLSHDLPAIGGGLIWPRVRFASDDWTIQISARAIRNAPWEPIRHLNDLSARGIEVKDFDHVVDDVIGTVLRRLKDLNVAAEPLATIWADVLAEREDPEVSEWRRWEARLGYDPDEAPERLMKQVAELFGRAGKSATSEIAPLLSANTSAILSQINALAGAPGLEAALPSRKADGCLSENVTPWDFARDMARNVRAEIGQTSGPLTDRTLEQLLGVPKDSLDLQVPPNRLIGLGVRSSDEGKAILHFRKRNAHGVRFEAARFVAESISAPAEDSLLPLNDRETARQKIQRAFAAELLAPIDEISEQIGDSSTSEHFEDLADRYGVSPLAIRSHLANHGVLSHEAVAV